MILQVQKINKSFGVKDVLTDVSFHIEDKEKACIVGVNGAGKSTLFKIITGEMSSDSGTIVFDKNKTIGYMSQKADLLEDESIYENLISVFSNLLDLEKQIEDVNDLLSKTNDNEKLIELSHLYDTLIEEYKEKGGYQYKGQITAVLNGLSLSDINLSSIVSTLSGGQKTRVALCKLLLLKPDILLLDEPTNHLDIDAINFLENYLRNYEKAVVIISHDRYFLDLIVTKVIEIENTKAKVYNGNFTDYTIQKEIDRQLAIKNYENYKKEVQRQEQVITLLKSFNREKSIKRARSREKLLSKMNVVDRPEEVPDSMRMSFTPSVTSGFDVLDVSNASKSFPGKELFSNLNFKIFKGEKVCLIGENGIGKTTLFKSILDNTYLDSGDIKYGSNVICAYYDQEHTLLDDDKTLFQEISDANPKMTNTEVRNALAGFVFTGDDVFKKVGVLSGGEKGRLSLLKLMSSKANFLLLDEPTNHLDMYSKEILENALNAYEGTVFFISHDRYFINSVCDKILYLSKDGLTEYNGDYDNFIENRKTEIITKDETITEAKKDRQAQKEEAKEAKKIERQIQKLEENIENCEKKLVELDEKLNELSSQNDMEKLQAVFLEKEKTENALNDFLVEWETLNE